MNTEFLEDITLELVSLQKTVEVIMGTQPDNVNEVSPLYHCLRTVNIITGDLIKKLESVEV